MGFLKRPFTQTSIPLVVNGADNAPLRGRQTKCNSRLASLAFSILILATAFFALAGPTVYPTGTTIYDPVRAYNSFVLFTSGDNIVHLIDMNGRSVHEWKTEGDFSNFIDPELVGGQRGHLLVTLETTEGSGTDLVPGRVNSTIPKTLGEVDWEGKRVWQFGENALEGKAQQHHDWSRLHNGNTLVLANLVHAVKGFKQPLLLDDVIYEVNREGEIVWQWIASEHLEEFGFTQDELALVRNSDSADYLHLNNMKAVGPNRWYDAGDSRFAPDNVIIDSRNANFIAIIDRKTGKVVWNLGPHYAVNDRKMGRRVPRPVDQISGQHDAQIIPVGLPGAGNLLVFDNQGEAGFPNVALSSVGGSRVLEIDPVKKQIVWQYVGEDSGGPSWSFRSTHISSARRLPNGNTLICEGQTGRLFQVTPSGDIVWEYMNPYFRATKDPVNGKTIVSRFLYRAQPVPYDWAPAGTPHSENAVVPPQIDQFHVPSGNK
jgi:hypothetical protein